MRLDLSALGPEIRRRRLARRIPLARLAEQAGIPRGQLAALERGEIEDVPVGRLQRVLHTLGGEIYVGTYNGGRPTIEELIRQANDEGAERDDTGFWGNGAAP